MSDDKTRKGEPDRRRININEGYEVRYWTGKFGVSEQELRAAVKNVGPMADAVEMDLQKKSA